MFYHSVNTEDQHWQPTRSHSIGSLHKRRAGRFAE